MAKVSGKLDRLISHCVGSSSTIAKGNMMNGGKFFVESNTAASMEIDELKYNWISEGIEYQEQEFNFCKDSLFDPRVFAAKHGYKTNRNVDRYSEIGAVIYKENIRIVVQNSSKKIRVVVLSKIEYTDQIKEQLFADLTPIGSMIDWVINDRGDSVQIPLQTKPMIKSAYPWIDGDPVDYINDYFDSDASILILIGPPGTGKTSLIRSIIEQSGGSAMITYDEKCMSGDGMFSQFIEGNAATIVFEDADNFLQPRVDGNSMMHRFLNVGDGLMSSRGKKMIFSTNLPNVSAIDGALTRPGRCFDIINFRELTQEEGKKVLLEIGDEKDLSGKETWSLAELTNKMRNNKKEARKVGFF